jgi:hypothetical protein
MFDKSLHEEINFEEIVPLEKEETPRIQLPPKI